MESTCWVWRILDSCVFTAEKNYTRYFNWSTPLRLCQNLAPAEGSLVLGSSWRISVTSDKKISVTRERLTLLGSGDFWLWVPKAAKGHEPAQTVVSLQDSQNPCVGRHSYGRFHPAHSEGQLPQVRAASEGTSDPITFGSSGATVH